MSTWEARLLDQSTAHRLAAMPSPTLKTKPGAVLHRVKWLLLIAGTAFYVLTPVQGPPGRAANQK